MIGFRKDECRQEFGGTWRRNIQERRRARVQPYLIRFFGKDLLIGVESVVGKGKHFDAIARIRLILIEASIERLCEAANPLILGERGA